MNRTRFYASSLYAICGAVQFWNTVVWFTEPRGDRVLRSVSPSLKVPVLLVGTVGSAVVWPISLPLMVWSDPPKKD